MHVHAHACMCMLMRLRDGLSANLRLGAVRLLLPPLQPCTPSTATPTQVGRIAVDERLRVLAPAKQEEDGSAVRAEGEAVKGPGKVRSQGIAAWAGAAAQPLAVVSSGPW